MFHAKVKMISGDRVEGWWVMPPMACVSSRWQKACPCIWTNPSVGLDARVPRAAAPTAPCADAEGAFGCHARCHVGRRLQARGVRAT